MRGFAACADEGYVMSTLKNTEFWSAVRGVRNAEAEIVWFYTARLRVPHNETMRSKNEFFWYEYGES